MPTNTECFTAITSKDLRRVQGGASRVTSRSGGGTDQLQMMLTQITSSIKDLASNKQDPMSSMLPMLMMMMGGGGGGGGQQVAAAPPPPPPPAAPVVKISTNVRG